MDEVERVQQEFEALTQQIGDQKQVVSDHLEQRRQAALELYQSKDRGSRFVPRERGLRV